MMIYYHCIGAESNVGFEIQPVVTTTKHTLEMSLMSMSKSQQDKQKISYTVDMEGVKIYEPNFRETLQHMHQLKSP